MYSMCACICIVTVSVVIIVVVRVEVVADAVQIVVTGCITTLCIFWLWCHCYCCSCCSIIWVHFCLNRFWACFDYLFDFENDLLFIGLVYLAYLVCQFVDLICSCCRMAISYHASVQYFVSILSDLLCYMLLGWIDVTYVCLL